jgi:hypothetical protein
VALTISADIQTRRTHERTSAKRLTVPLTMPVSSTKMKTAKLANVFARRTNAKSSNVSNLITVQTNITVTITNVLNKNVILMPTVMATTHPTNVSLTVKKSWSMKATNQSKNVPIPVNQLNVRTMKTVLTVTPVLMAPLLSHLKSAIAQMIRIPSVRMLPVRVTCSAENKKSAQSTNVKLWNAEPTHTVNHLMLTAKYTPVTVRPTSVKKLIALAMTTAVNLNDARTINAVPFHVPIMNTVHPTTYSTFSKNVVKMKANVSILNVKVTQLVTPTPIQLVAKIVLMENVNASKIIALSKNAEQNNIALKWDWTSISVRTTSVQKSHVPPMPTVKVLTTVDPLAVKTNVSTLTA